MGTFDSAPFLSEQIESILAQDYPGIRLWISDDGSTDATLDILKSYRTRLGTGGICVYRGPGRGFAANFLSLLARPEVDADLFAFADHDDIWEPDKISRAVAALGAEPATRPAVYTSRTRLVDVQGRDIGLSRLFTRPPSFANALVQSIGGGNTMVLNRAARDLVGRAETLETVSHDWWVYLLVTGAGGRMIYDPYPGVRYRQHGQNIVGMNVGWRMRARRLAMLVDGTFRDWTERNLRDLSRNRALLTSEAVATLDRFAAARRAGLTGRLRGARAAGVYRQNGTETAVLALALALGRL